VYKEWALTNGYMISCGVCGHVCAHLGRHIHTHGLTKEQYRQRYGTIVAPANQRKINQGLSEAIMNNSEERARRSERLGELNKREDFRKRASETAIKTSARKDIQKQRAARLKEWRDSNPEQFEKCWKTMVDAPINNTKPERWMKLWLQEQYPDQFKYSQFIYSKHMPTKSHKKQIDFIGFDGFVWIELDGPLHFKQGFAKRIDLRYVQEKDMHTNLLATERHKILIRISYDQWVQSTGRIKGECLKEVKRIIGQKIPGVYKIGREYDKNVHDV